MKLLLLSIFFCVNKAGGTLGGKRKSCLVEHLLLSAGLFFLNTLYDLTH